MRTDKYIYIYIHIHTRTYKFKQILLQTFLHTSIYTYEILAVVEKLILTVYHE